MKINDIEWTENGLERFIDQMPEDIMLQGMYMGFALKQALRKIQQQEELIDDLEFLIDAQREMNESKP